MIGRSNFFSPGSGRLAALALLCFCILPVASASSTSGFYLETLNRPIDLKAIARSDNGKAVGMKASLGRSYLKYPSFKGKLELSPYDKFDSHKLPPALSKHFATQMDGAEIYRVGNAGEFIEKNPLRTLIPKDKSLTFVTILDGMYVDGKSAIWICILSNPSMENFYATGLGHERCDAFRRGCEDNSCCRRGTKVAQI